MYIMSTNVQPIRRLAVLTSGGDAPGMNPAIRAVVRVATARGHEVYGIRHGYSGLLADEFIPLGPRDVGGIMERGGTMLGTARCTAMRTEAGQVDAVRRLEARGIDALVVIGGNGTQSGAKALSTLGVRVAGVASTIDNDLVGSDITIGATTAVDVALESVDRLRVTASSHGRVFLVEVMGRDCGYLATAVGIASGAEIVVTPEAPQDPEDVAATIRAAYERGKSHAIAVIAEGAPQGVEALAAYFKAHEERLGFDLRICKLGHVQRGGAPGATDRLLASRLAAAAVDHLDRGNHGVLLGMLGGKVTATPLADVAGRTKPADQDLVALAQVLAR
jgi:6-phosphofructokinase 1